MRKHFLKIWLDIWLVSAFSLSPCWAGTNFDNGSTTYLDCGRPTGFYVAPPITVGIRFRVGAMTRNYDGLLHFGYDTNDRWTIQFNSTNVYLQNHSDINNSNLTILSTTDVTNGVHTFIGTIDSTAGTTIYIDGIQDGSSASAGAKLGFNQLPTGSGGWTVANTRNSAGTLPEGNREWEGVIYEMFLSNSLWTQSMIDTFAKGEILRFPLQDSSLIEYWDFQEYSDGTNITGNVKGYNGTSCTSNNSPIASAEQYSSYP